MFVAITSPVDGEVPQIIRDVGDDWQTNPTLWNIAPEDVVIPRSDYRLGWVWDAANRRLREPTATDGKRAAAARKKQEFSDREQREFLKRFPHAGGNHDKANTEYITDVANAPPGQRVSERNAAIKADRDRRDRGFGNADAKVKDATATATDIDAMTWEGQ